MNIDIHLHDIHRPDLIRDRIARKVEQSLKRFRQAIRRLRVRLRDANGPRGGPGYEVLLQLSYADGTQATARAQGAVALAVAHAGIDRLQTQVRRRIGESRHRADP